MSGTAEIIFYNHTTQTYVLEIEGNPPVPLPNDGKPHRFTKTGWFTIKREGSTIASGSYGGRKTAEVKISAAGNPPVAKIHNGTGDFLRLFLDDQYLETISPGGSAGPTSKTGNYEVKLGEAPIVGSSLTGAVNVNLSIDEPRV